MLRIALVLLACAAWASAGTKAPAKGIAIDDVVVTGMKPATGIVQWAKVTEIKFFYGTVASSQKECVVIMGSLVLGETHGQTEKAKVTVTLSIPFSGPSRDVDIVAIAEFSARSTTANFIGVGPKPSDRSGRVLYRVAVTRTGDAGGDWKEPEKRESGLKE